MYFISFNVNGIRAASKKGLWDYFDQQQADFFCIQETKAHQSQLTAEFLERDSYQAYWAECYRKGYSGVVTYTKHKPLNVSYSIGEERFDREGRIVLLEYSDWVFYNIYFPNGQKDEERLQYKLDFYDCFLTRCKEWKQNGKSVIVCGDFNTAHRTIDLARPKPNENTSGFLPIEREWMDQFEAAGYIDTFRHFDKNPDNYSWWSYRANARANNVGWRIDYFFVDQKLAPKLIGADIQSNIHGSDHCPVTLKVNVQP